MSQRNILARERLVRRRCSGGHDGFEWVPAGTRERNRLENRDPRGRCLMETCGATTEPDDVLCRACRARIEEER